MPPILRNSGGPRTGSPDRNLPVGDKIAVVQSGGGAKGAYALGVMRAILSGASASTGYRPCDPEIYTGTSVGAYNAAIMASRPGQPPLAVLDLLERIWRQSIANTPGGCGNGVFRLRGLPIQELEPGCLLHPVSSATQFAVDSVYLVNQMMIRALRFSASDLPLPGRLLEVPDLSAFFDPKPLRDLIWSTVDLEGLRRSPKDLAVAASSWNDGETRVFWKNEIVRTRNLDTIMASTAIPGVFPPVHVDGKPYVDGGLTMNTPLKPAIRAGAAVLHVIYLDPLEVGTSPLPTYISTFEALARVFSIDNAAQIRNDIKEAERVNRGLEILGRLRRHADHHGRDSGELLGDLQVADEILAEMAAQPRRPVTIHRYLPPAVLANGAEILNFSINHIESLIEQGYRDAAQHDCEASECVLASAARQPQPAFRGRRLRRDARERIGSP
ncbi:MAG TPA: patatin-like phospholipase family protein [Thermoanaerobaculia bacterium]|nr:patatin-like phospholipase family protein [Thermoanaerobaculia bacterium]